MRPIDISSLFDTANDSSFPCGCNPIWGSITAIPSTTTTTSTTQIPIISMCSVLLNYGELLYSYEPTANANILLGNFTPGGGDIANTTTKIWFYNGTMFYEYNLQISPFVATFNRTINASLPISNLYVGLHAIDNNTLITSDTSVLPNRIVTLDITGGTAVEINSFDLPSGKYISGDIIFTQQSKVIVTTDGGGNCFLYQYDYPSGNLEIVLDLGDTMIYPYGLFENNDLLYLIAGGGKIFNIALDSPYTITEVNDSGLTITGASQNTTCITVSLNI